MELTIKIDDPTAKLLEARKRAKEAQALLLESHAAVGHSFFHNAAQAVQQGIEAIDCVVGTYVNNQIKQSTQGEDK